MINNGRIDIALADNTVKYAARNRDYFIPTGVKAKHWYTALPQRDNKKYDNAITVKNRLVSAFNRLRRMFVKQQTFAPTLCEAEKGA